MMSMTGFGRADYEDEQLQLWVEIKSYNSKNLDVYIQLPGDLSSYEQSLRLLLSKQFTRGKFDVKVGLSSIYNDLTLVPHASEQLSKIAQELNKINVQLQVNLRELQQFGLLASPSLVLYERPLQQTFASAMSALALFRVSEGSNHALAINQDMITIKQKIVILEERQIVASQILQERLLQAIREHQLSSGFNEQRLMEEVSYLLVKSSIKEEVVRLKSHLLALEELLQADVAIGRRLDFLAQEMHREANTIASKTEDIEIKEASLLIKEAIDSIREQGRNIE